MEERFERRGNVSPLTPRFIKFLQEELHGVSLDEVEDPNATKADYSCLNGLLVIEVKTLEKDASERVSNLTTELEKREDWPEFLGAWQVGVLIKNMEDPDELEQRFINRIGRRIVDHLRKSKSQLSAHRENHPRHNQVGMVALINEDHPEYHPHLVASIIQKELIRQRDERSKGYNSIDAVLYLSERHVVRLDDQIAFPILSITTDAVECETWKNDVLDMITRKWSQWSGASSKYSATDSTSAHDYLDSFSTIEHIPDQMKRHEFWSLQYKRNPYMREWDYDQLLNCWDDVMLIGLLEFVKDSPIKPHPLVVANSLEKLTHLIDEMAVRGMSPPEFDLDREIAAAKRLGCSRNVESWLRSINSGDGSETENVIQSITK